MIEYRNVRVALLGAGSVGSQVARLLLEHGDELASRAGAGLELVGIAVRDTEAERDVDLPKDLFTTDAESLILGADIVVELIGGIEPAREEREQRDRRHRGGAVLARGSGECDERDVREGGERLPDEEERRHGAVLAPLVVDERLDRKAAQAAGEDRGADAREGGRVAEDAEVLDGERAREDDAGDGRRAEGDELLGGGPARRSEHAASAVRNGLQSGSIVCAGGTRRKGLP